MQRGIPLQVTTDRIRRGHGQADLHHHVVLKPFKKALDETTIPVKQRDAILRVVELMVTADADEDTPFTIVNAA